MASSLLFPPLPSLFLSPKSPNPNSPPNPNFPSNPNSHFRPLLSSRRNTPETECPVPLDQQPVNEFRSLSETLPFSWANGGMRRYFSRLAFTGVGFAVFIGLPVAVVGKGYGDPQVEAVRVALGAWFTGLLAVTLAVLRMYLGWAYVGNRLLSATVEYEETGWYDGEIWVKTPEVLARDRLLGSYSVKPVLNRVKLTLVGLAISLVACGIVFVNIEPSKSSSTSDAPGGRAVSGVYDDASARSFEPDAFCGDPSQTETILSCTF